MQIYCASGSSPNVKAELSRITRNELGKLLPKFTFENSIPENEEKIVSIVKEHKQTYSIIKSLNFETGIILFDAHPDLLKNIDGEEDWLRRLVNERIVSPFNIIIVGARCIQSDEAVFIKEKNIRVIGMKSFHENGEEDILDAVMETARQWKNVYVSVDMDVVDPAFAPGVDSAETGGMTSREIISAVQRIRNMRNVIGLDVAEIYDEKDSNKMTAKLAAKLIGEFV